jgi:hypothetical protein
MAWLLVSIVIRLDDKATSAGAAETARLSSTILLRSLFVSSLLLLLLFFRFINRIPMVEVESFLEDPATGDIALMLLLPTLVGFAVPGFHIIVGAP